MPYIEIVWNKQSERQDNFKFNPYKLYSVGDRANFIGHKNTLNVFIDNIWKDTKEFNKFVEGLNVIYLTELTCLTYHFLGKRQKQWCRQKGASSNECGFFIIMKLIHNSHYEMNARYDVDDCF